MTLARVKKGDDVIVLAGRERFAVRVRRLLDRLKRPAAWEEAA